MARHWSEELAARHLQAKGYTLLASNYAVRGGEIDLVMQKGDLVVFVEVRQRRNARYGSAAASITARKLERLRTTALHYLVATFGRDDLPVRFDALLIEGTRARHNLAHLENILG